MVQASIEELQTLCGGADCDVSMNVEYRNGGVEYVTLMNTDKIAVVFVLFWFIFLLFYYLDTNINIRINGVQ